MAVEIYEQGGLVVTAFAGPVRTDHGDRRLIQITERMDLGMYAKVDDSIVMTIGQLDAFLDWIERNPDVRARLRPAIETTATGSSES